MPGEALTAADSAKNIADSELAAAKTVRDTANTDRAEAQSARNDAQKLLQDMLELSYQNTDPSVDFVDDISQAKAALLAQHKFHLLMLMKQLFLPKQKLTHFS